MGLIGGSIGYGLLRRLAPAPVAVGEGGFQAGLEDEPTGKLEQCLGPAFKAHLRGKTVIDFGCGDGLEAVTMARLVPDCRVIGLDIRPAVLERARARAARCGVSGRCRFTTSTDERADVIISIDAFEHFSDPHGVLVTMSKLLAPGGQVFAAFGPTWLHPYGGHLFSPFPWAHLIFSERALIRWRAHFRSDGATRFSEVDGGLNQLRIAGFERLVAASPLAIDHLETVPIRNLSFLRWKPLREFGSSLVRCRLVHRKASGNNQHHNGEMTA